MKSFVIVLLLGTAALAQVSEKYIGSKVFNIWPRTKQQRRIVGELEITLPGIDMWIKPLFAEQESRVLVLEDQLEDFEYIMKENDIQYSTFINDPKSVFEQEVIENRIAKARAGRRFDFTAFHRIAEIYDYLDDLAIRFPERVKVETAAVTGYGNPIKAVRISTTNFANTSKPIFMMDATIHAREWIAPPVAMYMVYKLVENVTAPELLNQIDWIIYPILNPDGYEYSHTTDRMWRKTMSNESGTDCLGVDGNRNYAIHWMEQGASNDSCSEVYAGPYAFSEVEARVIRDESAKYGSRIKAYVTTHSHGGFLIYPFAHSGLLPPNGRELHGVANVVTRSIDDHKAPGAKDYVHGNAAGEDDPPCCRVSGSSMDYVVDRGGTKLAYALELPSGGETGFDPPPSRIMQTVTETWTGLRALARYILYPVQ